MKKRRASEDYRIKDRKYTEKAMKKVRTSEKHCEKELAAQRATRQNPQRKMITKQNTLKSKRKARENKEFCEQEYKAQKAARQKPDMKIKTKQNTLKSMRKAREDKEFCEQEYKAQKAARQKPDMKIKTKQNTLKSMRQAREDKEFCEQEYKAQKAARQKPDMKIKTKQNTLRNECIQGNSDTLVDEADTDTNKVYTKRPKQLENWCLADVVSELEVAFPKEEFPRADKISEHNEDDTFEEENFEQEDVLVHLKNGIKIRRRKNKRVIRYVGYSKKTNSEQYFRERILLFLPWRNESTDIINGYTTFEQHYKSKANIINAIQKKYENFVDELEQARLQAECELDDFDEVAPNTEHNEAEDANIGPQPSEQLYILIQTHNIIKSSEDSGDCEDSGDSEDGGGSEDGDSVEEGGICLMITL
ncbi:axoneme-associated protein mst101(1)-like [Argopecten irradians]|uniref:axoneme-associated protein mst101(1)-like n=1 Tax=Argopecten irradians TaxID=31199 RepID=UPI003718F2B7